MQVRSQGARCSLLGPVSPLPKLLAAQVEAGTVWVAEGSLSQNLAVRPFPAQGPSKPLPVLGKVSVDPGSCHQPGAQAPAQGPMCWLLKGQERWVGLSPHISHASASRSAGQAL